MPYYGVEAMSENKRRAGKTEHVRNHGESGKAHENRRGKNDRLSKQIKLFIGVIIVLVLILVILLMATYLIRDLLRNRDGGGMQAGQTMSADHAMNNASHVRQTGAGETEILRELTAGRDALQAPSSETDDVPGVPAPEETLPIIITNTPTPTPSPSPTPSPVPTSTPSPTPVPDLTNGTVLKEANLRSAPSSSAKIKKKIKKNESVVIHDLTDDSSGKTWYYLSIEDTGTSGWMRDYLIRLDEPLPGNSRTVSEVQPSGSDGEEERFGEERIIGKAIANRAANVRQKPSLKASIIRQVQKGTELLILRKVRFQDIEWYEVQTVSGKTKGYMRLYTLTVQSVDETADTEDYTE